MNSAAPGARSFSPPPKGRHYDAARGGEWSSFNNHHNAHYSSHSHSHSSSHSNSRPQSHSRSRTNGSYTTESTETEQFRKLPSKTSAFASHHAFPDDSRRSDASKLLDQVPMNHRSFLDPEYEAEMLRFKRDILQSIVNSHGT